MKTVVLFYMLGTLSAVYAQEITVLGDVSSMDVKNIPQDIRRALKERDSCFLWLNEKLPRKLRKVHDLNYREAQLAFESSGHYLLLYRHHGIGGHQHIQVFNKKFVMLENYVCNRRIGNSVELGQAAQDGLIEMDPMDTF
jgi:hypothetical protein